MTQADDTTSTDATIRTKAVVTALVDEAIARRIGDALSDLADVSEHQRIRWITELLAQRESIISDVTVKASRLVDEPSAPTVDLQ
jgi:hypothetical protein